MPIVRTVRDYRLADLPYDLLAGLTVSVVDLPQSMAFALIAGVPAVYGLYTAIFLAFLGALFTSSRFLSVGP
ncbi:MAG TPA: SulP family inorganic anion transporter, partial [Candidatus Limiplasma sp.]|nr:SulP family inorganic anion transporter [Candidatus Limiplasma sp.]